MKQAFPASHTAFVLLLLGGLAVGSAAMGRLSPAPASSSPIGKYLVTMAAEWTITAVIWRGCARHQRPFRGLIGSSPLRLAAVLRDLAFALGFLVCANVVLALVSHLLHAAPNATLVRFLPHTAAQTAIYLLMALTAGFCEEVIFRGYLQRQFALWGGSGAVGLGAQGVIFGLCHAYQGWRMAGVIGVFGWMFGLLALWRRSLRPGIFAHFIQDGVMGLLLARILPR